MSLISLFNKEIFSICRIFTSSLVSADISVHSVPTMPGIAKPKPPSPTTNLLFDLRLLLSTSSSARDLHFCGHRTNPKTRLSYRIGFAHDSATNILNYARWENI